MIKCFVLILASLVTSTAFGQFNSGATSGLIVSQMQAMKNVDPSSYKYSDGKIFDKNNQPHKVKEVAEFETNMKWKLSVTGLSGSRSMVHKNDPVAVTCLKPSGGGRITNGTVESIRDFNGKAFVKVSSCEFIVESSYVKPLPSELPAKASSPQRSVAQKTSR